ADAINRPSTSAAMVPIRPMLSLTISLTSSRKWSAETTFRKYVPSSAPPNTNTKASAEMTSGFTALLLADHFGHCIHGLFVWIGQATLDEIVALLVQDVEIEFRAA